MERLQEEIQRIKDKTQEHFWEIKRYYNATCLDIFEDDYKSNIFVVQSVVQQVRRKFEDASSDDNIR